MAVTIQDDMLKVAKRLPEEQGKCLIWALVEYGIDGIEPELEETSSLLFEAFRSRIELSTMRSEVGKKGAKERWHNGKNEFAKMANIKSHNGKNEFAIMANIKSHNGKSTSQNAEIKDKEGNVDFNAKIKENDENAKIKENEKERKKEKEKEKEKVIQKEKDKEKEINKEKEKEKIFFKEKENLKEKENSETFSQTSTQRKTSRFVKPTVEEIQAYLFEKGYSIDAEQFWNHYESVGWVVGKSPMKNWHAAVATWQRRLKTTVAAKSAPLVSPTVASTSPANSLKADLDLDEPSNKKRPHQDYYRYYSPWYDDYPYSNTALEDYDRKGNVMYREEGFRGGRGFQVKGWKPAKDVHIRGGVPIISESPFTLEERYESDMDDICERKLENILSNLPKNSPISPAYEAKTVKEWEREEFSREYDEKIKAEKETQEKAKKEAEKKTLEKNLKPAEKDANQQETPDPFSSHQIFGNGYKRGQNVVSMSDMFKG